tara:strand:- start:83 stop:529 length:447 start_codon:yes stop_codon:yes gene_type:complete
MPDLTPEQRRAQMKAMNIRQKANKDNAARVAKREKDANFTATDVKSGNFISQGMQQPLRSEMTKNVTRGKDGYFTPDIHPEQPRSKNSKGYAQQQEKFKKHDFQATKKANQYNRMINDEKKAQGRFDSDVSASVRKIASGLLGKGIGL